MAQYKHSRYLKQDDSSAYDELHKPGSSVNNSGVYRCEHCGREIAHTKSSVLPSQNHHQHSPAADIQWRLVVLAQT